MCKVYRYTFPKYIDILCLSFLTSLCSLEKTSTVCYSAGRVNSTKTVVNNVCWYFELLNVLHSLHACLVTIVLCLSFLTSLCSLEKTSKGCYSAGSVNSTRQLWTMFVGTFIYSMYSIHCLPAWSPLSVFIKAELRFQVSTKYKGLLFL